MTDDAEWATTAALVRVTARPAAACARREALLEQDLGVDSLALLELVETLQAALRIVVPDEITARIRTVAELQDAVASLLITASTNTTTREDGS